MRHVRLGIRSVLHCLTKCLLKPLPAAMGNICSNSPHNLTNLIERIKHMDMMGKKMTSLDVKAMAMLAEGAMETADKVLLKMSASDLPVWMVDKIK